MDGKLAAALGPVPAPSPFEAAASVPIPDSEHEYHCRKAAGDAAYKQLAFVPVVTTMPVPRGRPCEPGEVKFMWTRKPGHH